MEISVIDTIAVGEKRFMATGVDVSSTNTGHFIASFVGYGPSEYDAKFNLLEQVDNFRHRNKRISDEIDEHGIDSSGNHDTSDIMDVIGYKFDPTKLMLTNQILPKRLSNYAYQKAKSSSYEEFLIWWDNQI